VRGVDPGPPDRAPGELGAVVGVRAVSAKSEVVVEACPDKLEIVLRIGHRLGQELQPLDRQPAELPRCRLSTGRPREGQPADHAVGEAALSEPVDRHRHAVQLLESPLPGGGARSAGRDQRSADAEHDRVDLPVGVHGYRALVASDAVTKSIGLALAVGVLIDAFVVRMTLVPAVMVLLGNRAWSLPRWLDRLLPNLDIEGESISGARDETDPAHGPQAEPALA
jgi:hypothetical protein